MNVLVKLVLENFPKLSYCDVINKSDRNGSKIALEPLSGKEEIEKWIDWLYKTSDSFELLRIKLSTQKELIFSKVDADHYLVIHNENENVAILLSFLNDVHKGRVVDFNSDTKKAITTEESSEPKETSQLDLKMMDALRIQKMIIPRDAEIQKKFKKFFVVHQQQDMVGGDFYWFQETPNGALVSLVDCTGHSLEGAMASMVCNSLLNQAYSNFDSSDVTSFVSDFYGQFNSYNDTTKETLDYGIGAELAVFYFDYDKKEIKFVSTGISAFLRKKEGVELLKARKVMDYSKVSETISQTVLDMKDVLGLYTFTDGLTDQYDSKDQKKLGYKGVKKMIESESDFCSEYYLNEISKWKGENMQYDDITLLGLAI
ncbi:MAG: SpoIIE family protein phosphatase [Cyclobacteriaceae bacterium]